MRLLVILASPPLTTSGKRTLNQVAALAQVIPGAEIVVGNIYAEPTIDLPAMVRDAVEPRGWVRAREALASELQACDAVFAAWGLWALSGPARIHRKSQLEWLAKAALARQLPTAWTVGGQPRHPSRWHQYVSDKYARTAGDGDFGHRLAQVIMEVPLSTLVAR